ncbi:transposase [Enterobacter sp. 638]|uniref:Tn3 transposase DDE domain-containing protein n=1 Tax=Enterobacter sp. (strain 638) TaxID=399742 RepID=A0A9J9L035_ENT38|nr:hypothetical protein Ent638_4319 [Enterobacter sp. 638]
MQIFCSARLKGDNSRDTAGSSDLIFGLFWLLGYQFSPRLADAGAVSTPVLVPRTF